MGNKRVLGLLVIVATLGILIWQVWRNREPEYDGVRFHAYMALKTIATTAAAKAQTPFR